MTERRPAPLLAYVVTVFALSWALQGWIAWQGGIDGDAFRRLAPAVMFVPGLTGLGFALRRRGALRWRVRSPAALAAGALLPAIAAVLCSLAIQAAGIATSEALRWQGGRLHVDHRLFVLGSGEQSLGFFLVNLAARAPVFSVLAGLLAVGEELGWRGYLQEPLVSRLGTVRGLSLLGLLWGWWHLPLVLMGYNYPETPVLGGLILLPLVGVGLSFFLAGLTLPSRGFWPAVLAHGSVNAFFGVLVYGLDFTRPRLLADGLVLATTSLLGVVGWWLLQRAAAGSRSPSAAAVVATSR